MAVVIYKDGVSARVEPKRLQAHINAGWSLSKDGKSKEADKAPECGLAAEYEARFGKKPHHKMKGSTIAEKLAEASDD